jgi:hypothetical protein
VAAGFDKDLAREAGAGFALVLVLALQLLQPPLHHLLNTPTTL